jgi:hypothetical protein
MRTKLEKMEQVISTITNDFDSMGDFLQTLFYIHSRADRESHKADPRAQNHQAAVTTLLQGSASVRIADIITLIYKHPQSQPSTKSDRFFERKLAFSPGTSIADIRHALPALSTWEMHLVADRLSLEITTLTRDDPSDPTDHAQLRASANERSRSSTKVLAWHDLGKLSMQDIADRYQRRAPLVWYITQRMTTTQKQGLVITRIRRPVYVVR